MKVGRFQVMATLQAARAYILGLPLESALSWGLNRSIFYAAAKRGFKGGPGVKGKGAKGKGSARARARDKLADMTEGYTGADLAAVANAAALAAVKEYVKTNGKEADQESGTISISMHYLEEAVQKIRGRRGGSPG